jgi:ABC-type dipeptide/oligopeptide/nickel transport system ATPase component
MTLSEEDMRQVRLARITLVLRGSMNSLNPVMRIKEQLADALQDYGIRLSKGLSPTACRSIHL